MSALYRNFTPQELDQQYRARATVSEEEFQQNMAQYKADTLKARENTKHHLHLACGESEDEYLDLYLSDSKNAPLFIYIHGGYWRMLGAEDSGFMAENFTQQGVHVAVINYGLAPKTRLSEIIQQNQRAMQWLHANIAHYGGNPNKLYVAGSSAGGHLAALMAHEKGVIGACLLSGIYDITPMRQTFTQEWLQLEPHEIEPISPWFNPPPAHVKLIFAYGKNESSEFKRQTHDFMQLCTKMGSETSLIHVPNSTHFNLVFELQTANSQLFKEIITLLNNINNPNLG